MLEIKLAISKYKKSVSGKRLKLSKQRIESKYLCTNPKQNSCAEKQQINKCNYDDKFNKSLQSNL